MALSLLWGVPASYWIKCKLIYWHETPLTTQLNLPVVLGTPLTSKVPPAPCSFCLAWLGGPLLTPLFSLLLHLPAPAVKAQHHGPLLTCFTRSRQLWFPFASRARVWLSYSVLLSPGRSLVTGWPPLPPPCGQGLKSASPFFQSYRTQYSAWHTDSGFSCFVFRVNG